jgi:hypothetical protein
LRRVALVAFISILVFGATAIPAGASDGFPEYQGSEWTDLVREGLARLPNLNPPGSPGVITGSATLDNRIWEIAFARGYEMRQTPSSTMPVQDGYVMQSLTASAWEGLQAAAAAAGHNMVVHSGYRSTATQRTILNSKLSGSSDAAINAVLDYSAPPGASRHHTGYALDIKVSGGTIGQFGNSAAFVWLSANNYLNAKRFGFVPSYPPGVTNQGPKPEPWEYMYVGVETIRNSDELFFYREDGTFRFYDVDSAANLGSPILSGSGYSQGWSVITGVDLEGDGTDEMLFYRGDGTFKYYDLTSGGGLVGPILSGSGYSHKWDSIISVDLDGDGGDEMFFYDAGLGLYGYYAIDANAKLSAPLQSGTGYSLGWTSITSVDLDGDGTDEMLFYRTDGVFKFYETKPTGGLGNLLSQGTGYSKSWSSITSVDLDGDGADEMLFYRASDGVFKYYEMKPDGSLGSLVKGGAGYSPGWTSITAVNLD